MASSLARTRPPWQPPAMRRILIAAAAGTILAAPAVSASDSQGLGVAFLCSAERKADPTGEKTLKILPGMGSGGFTIAAKDPQAQLWFDYGIKLYHGFYHDEAKTAFDKAAEADPACAMCAWGQALAHGSNMNFDAKPEDIVKAKAFAARAQSLSANEDPKAKALIAALVTRYATPLGDNKAYAKAMDALAEQYPDDKEIATLTAHALLLEAARKYDFTTVNRSVGLLEAVLAKHPDDTAAIHYYIHATEFMGEAPKALPYAEKLAKLAPDASHLVHMAAHTLIHVGRYEDVGVLNAEAIATDARFDSTMNYKRALGEAGYYGHNFGFGLAGAMLAGDRDLSVKYATHRTIAFPPETFAPDRRAGLTGRSYAALGRYAPEQALALPEPAANELFIVKAMRHYARGEAFAAKGDAGAVLAEAEAIDKLKRTKPGERTMGELASSVLEGRALMLQGKPDKAARVYAKAARLQERAFKDSFDPPPWWYPIRRSLAAAQLKAGDYKAAETEARASLAGWPDDALALAVLSQAERAQGKAAQAATDLETARKAWKGDLAAVRFEMI